MTDLPARRPALAKHLDWLDNTAARLEREADETESMATGQVVFGGGSRSQHFRSLDLVKTKRDRAAGYRQRAYELRNEELKKRRTRA